MRGTKNGFTILELLVVVGIIALASALVMAGLSSAREKSRDARRISDMKQLQNALGLYQISNRTFPISPTPGTPIALTGSDAVSLELQSDEYISIIPKDPQDPSQQYTYDSSANGSTYTLGFCLETNNIPGYVEGCGNTIMP